MLKIILPCAFSFLLYSCNKSNFEYVKLSDYKFQKAELKPFTEVELLSVSGGKQCTNSEIYFYQFVVIDKTTNDTVRILSPCQTYDETLKPRNGNYIPIDNSPEGINKHVDPNGGNVSYDNFYVVINKTHFTETRNYKTIIGGVGFK